MHQANVLQRLLQVLHKLLEAGALHLGIRTAGGLLYVENPTIFAPRPRDGRFQHNLLLRKLGFELVAHQLPLQALEGVVLADLLAPGQHHRLSFLPQLSYLLLRRQR